MTLILLEALLALLLLVGIVWWTMFSGRPKGELPPSALDAQDAPQVVGVGPNAGPNPAGSASTAPAPQEPARDLPKA